MRQVFICLRPRIQSPLPPNTLYIRVYSILVHTGKGEELNQREVQRGNRGGYRSQNCVENTKYAMQKLAILSLQSLINICHKVPLQVYFVR